MTHPLMGYFVMRRNVRQKCVRTSLLTHTKQTTMHERYGLEWGVMTAAALVSTISPIVLAFTFQKYLIRGLVSGAVKS